MFARPRSLCGNLEARGILEANHLGMDFEETGAWTKNGHNLTRSERIRSRPSAPLQTL